MKILLVYPPTPASKPENACDVSPHLSSYLLGTYLENMGHRVKVIDGPYAWGVPINEKGISTIIAKFKHTVSNYQPDLIGFSCFTGIEYFMTKILAKESDVYTIAGGYCPTAMPKEFINELDVDAVVIGDGEITTHRICESIEKFGEIKDQGNIYGVAFKKDERIIYNPPKISKKSISDIMNSGIQILNPKLMENMDSYGFFPIIASRGCPFNCYYCGEFRHYYLKYSPEKVIQTIENAMEISDINAITFYDALFPATQKWLNDFVRLKKERKLNFKWAFQGRTNIKNDVIRKAKEGECALIQFGVESFSPTMLVKMNKTKNPELYLRQTLNAFRSCKKYNMLSRLNIMIGYPGETIETLRETWYGIKNLIEEVHGFTYPAIFVFIPYPGSYIWDHFDESEAEFIGERYWWKQNPFEIDIRRFRMKEALVSIKPSPYVTERELRYWRNKSDQTIQDIQKKYMNELLNNLESYKQAFFIANPFRREKIAGLIKMFPELKDIDVYLQSLLKKEKNGVMLIDEIQKDLKKASLSIINKNFVN